MTIEKNEYGKPYIKQYPNIYFNISHCEKLIACSIDEFNNGIDVELIREFDRYVAERICSKEELEEINSSKYPERSFFSYWTLKESLGKALGVGLNYDTKKTTFVIDNNKIYCSNNKFKYKLFRVFQNYLLAVSTERNIDEIILKEVVMVNGELNKF